MTTAIERIATLTVGTVESVAPGEIKVLLELDAPQDTALNTGTPTRFPRINGYVLIPNESGAVVGLVVWLGVERSAFPKRTGLKDFGLIDLPFPLRKMTLTPVGTLVESTETEFSDSDTLTLQRGISAFPSVGDAVLLPTEQQLHAIVQARGSDRRIHIGTSPLASNARVFVDPDKLFGRHLAVLGNTGSGKSCSVAGLVRWSLNAASEALAGGQAPSHPNARFIVLDPNGEYARAFEDMTPTPRLIRVPPVATGALPLTVPAWMWNSHEWSAFAMAQPGVQRPLLMRALRELRAGHSIVDDPATSAARVTKGYRIAVEQFIAGGVGAFGQFPGTMNFGGLLNNLADDLGAYAAQLSDAAGDALSQAVTTAKAVSKKRGWTSGKTGWNAFSETDVKAVLVMLQDALTTLPVGTEPTHQGEDAPIPFDVRELPEHIEHLARDGAQNIQFVANLVLRIRGMFADTRLAEIVAPPIEKGPTVPEWLETILGDDKPTSSNISIIDLSLVPSDVLHLVIAVIARLVFEALQRYRKLTNDELPTTIILEEAHTFVSRGSDAEDNNVATPAQMCRQTFERIAREGRKFGLGLVLSSQRPSELSPTVLAQCNTFLLHRIVNDRDQELIAKLVPDDLRGMLRELPSLPTRLAVLLGWATPVPILVELRELAGEHRPRSADPRFWETWSRTLPRKVDWDTLADDWVS